MRAFVWESWAWLFTIGLDLGLPWSSFLVQAFNRQEEIHIEANKTHFFFAIVKAIVKDVSKI